jgi:hypothetical protein
MTVYVSWNGATQVAKWQVVAGPTAGELKPVKTMRRTGFETTIALPSMTGYVAVVALDAHGKQLRASAPTAL